MNGVMEYSHTNICYKTNKITFKKNILRLFWQKFTYGEVSKE